MGKHSMSRKVGGCGHGNILWDGVVKATEQYWSLFFNGLGNLVAHVCICFGWLDCVALGSWRDDVNAVCVYTNHRACFIITIIIYTFECVHYS